MARNLVDALYTENNDVSDFLRLNNQVSFASTVDNTFRKVLLIAAASYFEVTLVESVLNFLNSQLKENHPLYKIVKAKGIDMQYHKWFEWERPNANHFFAMFGDGFRIFMKQRIERDPPIESGIGAFMQLGALRNLLVHENFAEFTVDRTPGEIYDLYKTALIFVYAFPGCLSEYSATI